MKTFQPRYWLDLSVTLLILVGCGAQTAAPSQGPTPDALPEDAVVIQDLDIASGQTIFVPAYSEVYYASEGRTLELAVTLSVHNTDFEHPIILTSVRYYNTQGQLLKEYLDQPLRLGPLASADFFVDSGEQTGGVGTNFIVEWVAEEPIYEPVVEALMLSTASAQGISFSSPGRVIRQIE